jgi:hypothetical protein
MNEQTPPAGGTPPAPGTIPPAPGTTPPAGTGPTPQDIGALLSWDPANGDPPTDTVSVADLKAWQQKHDDEIKAATATAIRNEQETAAQAARAQEQSRAQQMEDINWASDLDTKLRSSDPAVQASAAAMRDANHDRYVRGLARGLDARDQAAQSAVLSDYLGPMWRGVIQAGHKELVDGLQSPTVGAKFGDNWLLAVIDYGKTVGIAEGRAAAQAEFETQGRLETGAQGGPRLGGVNGNPGIKDIAAGIERKPGAASEVFARIAEQNRRR